MSGAFRRRDLLGRMVGALVGGGHDPPSAGSTRRMAPPPALPPIPIRPPGAVGEARFLELCTRCDACEAACAPGILLRLGPAYGKAEGTPGFFPDSGACRLCPELACAKACTTGALVPPARPTEVRVGVAKVVPGRCLAAGGTPCDECAQACPAGVLAIRLGAEGPRVLADRCTGCGLCVEACPAAPKALRVLPAV